jgi:hypothetical protein
MQTMGEPPIASIQYVLRVGPGGGVVTGGVAVTTTTTVVVDVGLAGTTTVTVDVGVSSDSVAVGAAEIVGVGDKEAGAQGVPTSSKAVVIVIQASCDCSDMIPTATLSTTPGSSVVK